MLTRLLSAGLLAGVLAGICVASLQHLTTTPLILKAETYENGSAAITPHDHSGRQSEQPAVVVLVHAAAEPSAGSSATTGSLTEWAPGDGLERTIATTVTTIGAAVGFGLMLLAVMLASGAKITTSSAALWGAAGFAVTALAPGLGLAPQLPGSAAADIVLRQSWWLATAAATAVGLWLMWRTPSRGIIAASLILIALPHVVGAPLGGDYASAVPAELAAQFTSSSLAVHAILWVLVGTLAGYFWDRDPAATT